MTCDQLEIWISAYQDGEMEPRRRRLVEAHLAACSECRALGEEMAALATTLRADLERWEPPDTLHTRVMHRVPEPKPAAAPSRGGRTPRGWLSFGLVPVGLLAAWLLTLKPRPVAPPPSPVRITNNVTSPAVGPSGSTSPKPLSANPGRKDRVRNAADDNHGTVQGPAGEPPKGTTRSQAGPRRPASTPGGVRRAPRTGTELEPLRRLIKLRPPRWQERMVEGPRLRQHPPVRMAGAPRPVRPDMGGRQKPSPARITVVDYVLPEVPAPAAETGTKTKTEFVLRAAEPYQVSTASFDY
jgi:hypothetical protein